MILTGSLPVSATSLVLFVNNNFIPSLIVLFIDKIFDAYLAGGDIMKKTLFTTGFATVLADYFRNTKS